jgi:hypothetical protein
MTEINFLDYSKYVQVIAFFIIIVAVVSYIEKEDKLIYIPDPKECFDRMADSPWGHVRRLKHMEDMVISEDLESVLEGDMPDFNIEISSITNDYFLFVVASATRKVYGYLAKKWIREEENPLVESWEQGVSPTSVQEIRSMAKDYVVHSQSPNAMIEQLRKRLGYRSKKDLADYFSGYGSNSRTRRKHNDDNDDD